MIISVYCSGSELGWTGDRLATRQEFECFWNKGQGQYLALSPGEVVRLADGTFRLSKDLDLIECGDRASR